MQQGRSVHALLDCLRRLERAEQMHAVRNHKPTTTHPPCGRQLGGWRPLRQDRICGSLWESKGGGAWGGCGPKQTWGGRLDAPTTQPTRRVRPLRSPDRPTRKHAHLPQGRLINRVPIQHLGRCFYAAAGGRHDGGIGALPGSVVDGGAAGAARAALRCRPCCSVRCASAGLLRQISMRMLTLHVPALFCHALGPRGGSLKALSSSIADCCSTRSCFDAPKSAW
jgi:hypothetical protein